MSVYSSPQANAFEPTRASNRMVTDVLSSSSAPDLGESEPESGEPDSDEPASIPASLHELGQSSSQMSSQSTLSQIRLQS
jgi:hypothetical protein